jgi:phage-related protein
MKRNTRKLYTSQPRSGNVPSKEEEQGHVSRLQPVEWLGDAHRVLCGWAEAIQDTLGYHLYLVQDGQHPPDSKPVRAVGKGVFELADQDERAWYRVLYVRLGGTVYVLHCFEKRTNQIEQRDIDTASERLTRLQQYLREGARNAARTADRASDHGKRSR